MHGVGDYIPAAPSLGVGPKLEVNIAKLGNGYTLALQVHPEPPKRRKVQHTPSPFVGQDPDELIDKILDGMSALIRTINDKGAGEDWKDGGDRKQVREAFRVMFPGMATQIDRAVSDEPPPTYQEPRYEQLVFESKEKLIEFLTKEL